MKKIVHRVNEKMKINELLSLWDKIGFPIIDCKYKSEKGKDTEFEKGKDIIYIVFSKKKGIRIQTLYTCQREINEKDLKRMDGYFYEIEFIK